MDVKNSKDIKANLEKIKGKLDVLLDDSTHEFEDQIRIIKNSYKFLKKDGIIIIEDKFIDIKKAIRKKIILRN